MIEDKRVTFSDSIKRRSGRKYSHRGDLRLMAKSRPPKLSQIAVGWNAPVVCMACAFALIGKSGIRHICRKGAAKHHPLRADCFAAIGSYLTQSNFAEGVPKLVKPLKELRNCNACEGSPKMGIPCWGFVRNSYEAGMAVGG